MNGTWKMCLKTKNGEKKVEATWKRERYNNVTATEIQVLINALMIAKE